MSKRTVKMKKTASKSKSSIIVPTLFSLAFAVVGGLVIFRSFASVPVYFTGCRVDDSGKIRVVVNNNSDKGVNVYSGGIRLVKDLPAGSDRKLVLNGGDQYQVNLIAFESGQTENATNYTGTIEEKCAD